MFLEHAFSQGGQRAFCAWNFRPTLKLNGVGGADPCAVVVRLVPTRRIET